MADTIFMSLEDATRLLTKIEIALAELDAAVGDGEIDDSVRDELLEEHDKLANLIEDQTSD